MRPGGFNHYPESDEPSINYWAGKIKATDEQYDAYYEYNIPLAAVDETGEKKINFQFRPALPNAKHVDSGNRIKSMPEDLPEGLRVQIQSSNVHPDHYLKILRGYVPDTYFSLDQCERELDLSMDPNHELVEYEQRVAVSNLMDADLTPKQKETLRTIATDGQTLAVAEIADQSDVSESTVRRTVKKLSDIFTLTRGRVAPEDDAIGRKLKDIFYSIDHVLDQAKHSIQRLSSQREIISEDSVLGKWARRYAVTVEKHADGLEVAVNLGELSEYHFVKIIRAGYDAAKAIGSRTRSQFIEATFTYTTHDGTDRTAIVSHYGYQSRILGYPLR